VSILEVTAINGQSLEVDISDEACEKFGFRHGEKISDQSGRFGVVVGVAPIPMPSRCTEAGTGVLWISIDGSEGRVCFFPDPTQNLRKA
jgi:hypothetical protein